MPAYSKRPGAGVDSITGKPLDGWPHVEQSVDRLFKTYFGTRPIRRWFGTFVPRLLGENIEPHIVARFFNAIYAGLAAEPRFALQQVRVITDNIDELRGGRLALSLEGYWRPRGHLEDYTAEGAKQIIIDLYQFSVRVQAEGLQ